MASGNNTCTSVLSDYSGLYGNMSLTNENILEIAKQSEDKINGSILFALKYRMFPCNFHSSLNKNEWHRRISKEEEIENCYHATR